MSHPYNVRLRSSIQEELLDGIACFAERVEPPELTFEVGEAKDLDGSIHGTAREVINESGH
jgi:hypothetical protein